MTAMLMNITETAPAMGQVVLTTNVPKLSELAAKIPATMHLMPGVKVTAGQYAQTATVQSVGTARR